MNTLGCYFEPLSGFDSFFHTSIYSIKINVKNLSVRFLCEKRSIFKLDHVDPQLVTYTLR